tara:strand:- start:4 stop:195 length:192 start_codon:yes stop_codon:yes gene_type:complete
MDTLYEDMKELAKRITWLKGENERLRIENGLLRKASVEQRELNGKLRVELQQMDDFALGKNRS